jgi:hypothetical protein
MKYCPFCVGHHAYSETAYVAHLARHSPTYAVIMATAIRLGHQERAKHMNEAVREIRRGYGYGYRD